MLSWLMSLILILFGVSVPMTGGQDQPELDCSKPLTGTIEQWWGLAPDHAINSYTTELADGQVTMTVGSPSGDKATLSKPAPAELVAALCKAINDVPPAEWNAEVQVTDISPLMVEMSDGAAHVQGEVFAIDGFPRIQAVSDAERALTSDLYAKLKKEAEAWG